MHVEATKGDKERYFAFIVPLISRNTQQFSYFLFLKSSELPIQVSADYYEAKGIDYQRRQLRV